MNIYEISDEFAISLAKLKRMEKRGCLKLNSTGSDAAGALRHYLARNQQLTVGQLMMLNDSPSLFSELGKWQDRAREQIEALGDVKASAAPSDVTAYIDDAARGDSEAIEILVQWLKGVLPSRPVGHAWVAMRLLINLPDNLRAYNIRRIPMALLNVRSAPSFAGWFGLVPNGKNRSATIYAKPRLALDL